MHAAEEIGVVQGTDERWEIRTDICKREKAGLVRWEYSQREIKPTWAHGVREGGVLASWPRVRSAERSWTFTSLVLCYKLVLLKTLNCYSAQKMGSDLISCLMLYSLKSIVPLKIKVLPFFCNFKPCSCNDICPNTLWHFGCCFNL